MQLPGRIFLLVTGVIYIISGSIAIMSGFFLDMAGQALGGLGGIVGVQGAGAGLGGLAFLSVIFGALSFVIGVMGIAHRNNFDKAATLMTLGIIALIADVIAGLIMGTFTITTVLFLAIPGCYIFGAYKNKNS